MNGMITKKDILNGELMRQLLEIRVDSLWRMMSMKDTPYFPKLDEEGATGTLDNKGALFVPGGFIYEDSDKRSIDPINQSRWDRSIFRELILESMKFDNATLLYPGSVVSGINLDNGFFSEVASNILELKYAASRRKRKLETNPPIRISSDDITHSNTPNYINFPYGSRTKLSSCISVCLSEPRTYYSLGKHIYGLRNGDEDIFWESVRTSMEPVFDKEGYLLAQPHLVVCHNTRYREDNLVGITKVLGIGKFGEFATVTMEKAGSDLLKELGPDKTSYSDQDIIASYGGIDAVGVVRIYPSTNPGKRSLKHTTALIDLARDLDIDKGEIELIARERYSIT